MERLTNLETEKIGPQLWRLIRPLMYTTGAKLISVPMGFITDGASCPAILWTLCAPMTGPQAEAAVLHDFLYSKDSNYPEIGRAEADKMFLDGMITNGTSAWRAKAIYAGVRSCGMHSWKKCCSIDKIKG